jgi:two-component system chemotaxis response regulator CheB
MDDQRLRVLIVDDTIVYRRILGDAVAALEGAEVVGTAANGRLALAQLARSPADLVLLDVEMPEMDGLVALRLIRRMFPRTRVVMVSGADRGDAELTVHCLEQGALDFIRKPEGTDPEVSRAQLRARLEPLVRHLRDAVHAPAAGAGAPAPTAPVPAPGAAPARIRPAVPAAAVAGRIDLVAIGVSTGGPNALSELLPRLPADFPVPVLVVQHMPPRFTAFLAEHLAPQCPLGVREARDGEHVRPGAVLIAPGGRHMVVRRGPEGGRVVGLNDNPPENSCRPSVDVLFRSLAAQWGGNVLAVVMTGMGCDGLDGVRALKRRGCLCLTQSEASCIVYGMPAAVDEAGLSDQQVPLDRLADRILALVRPSWGGR